MLLAVSARYHFAVLSWDTWRVSLICALFQIQHHVTWLEIRKRELSNHQSQTWNGACRRTWAFVFRPVLRRFIQRKWRGHLGRCKHRPQQPVLKKKTNSLTNKESHRKIAKHFGMLDVLFYSARNPLSIGETRNQNEKVSSQLAMRSAIPGTYRGVLVFNATSLNITS